MTIHYSAYDDLYESMMRGMSWDRLDYTWSALLRIRFLTLEGRVGGELWRVTGDRRGTSPFPNPSLIGPVHL